MNNKEFLLELWRIFVKNRLSAWAAKFLIVIGIGMLTPEWWFGIANAAFFYVTGSNIKPFDDSPTTGWIFLFIGLCLVGMSIWETKQTKNKEIIGIRHKSLGNFPKEAIKPNLPFLQKLWHYRELDIDHTDSYENGTLADHQSVLRRIQKAPTELNGILHTSTETPIAYYGLTHIPLSFYLGYLLSDNKYIVQLYELNNESGRWDLLSAIAPSINLVTDYKELTSTTSHGDVVLSIGISYPIHSSEIDELEINNVLGQVSIEAKNPKRQLITGKNQITQICDEFKSTLERIKNTCPNRQKLHIFYSGPTSLSFALGRCISERIDPDIVVYNYSIKGSPKYNWSISFNSSSSTPDEISALPEKGNSYAPV